MQGRPERKKRVCYTTYLDRPFFAPLALQDHYYCLMTHRTFIDRETLFLITYQVIVSVFSNMIATSSTFAAISQVL